jgi:hypothetical protein
VLFPALRTVGVSGDVIVTAVLLLLVLSVAW